MCNLLRYVVAVVEIAGGLLGLGIVGWGMVASEQFGWAWLLFLAGFGLSLAAGIALWTRPAVGAPLSLGVQALQVFSIESTRLTYLFGSGLGFWVKFGSGVSGFNASLGSSFQFAWTTGFGSGVTPQPTVVGVNLVALAAIAALLVWMVVCPKCPSKTAEAPGLPE